MKIAKRTYYLQTALSQSLSGRMRTFRYKAKKASLEHTSPKCKVSKYNEEGAKKFDFKKETMDKQPVRP